VGVLLVAAGTACCGRSALEGSEPADLASGVGSEGGAPTGCVDVVMGRDLFADHGEWSHGVGFCRGGAWGTPGLVHVAWLAWRLDGTPWLVVSTFDAATGAVVRHRRDSLAAPLHWHDDCTAAAGDPFGHFAVAYSRAGASPFPTEWHVALGNVHGSAPPVVTDVGEFLVNHIGWDGEAFAVHGEYVPDLGELVLRIDAAGNVVLAAVLYGAACNSCYERNEGLVTDADSGISYGFFGGGALAGHYRDGTPLPGMHDGHKDIVVPGVQLSWSDWTLGADANGAWLRPWGTPAHVYEDQAYAVRVDTAGNPTGDAVVVPYDPQAGFSWSSGMLAEGSGFLALFSSNAGLLGIPYTGTGFAPVRTIVDPGPNPDPSPYSSQWYSAAHQHLFTAGGDPWILFDEANEGGSAGVRLLSLRDGCSYPSLRLKAPAPE
jgi:hypothetical protein